MNGAPTWLTARASIFVVVPAISSGLISGVTK
jgi:hypothetical protein